MGHAEDILNTDKKAFVKNVLPIFDWCANCNNPFYESVDVKFNTNIKHDEFDVYIHFFIDEKHGGGSDFAFIYQFHSEDRQIKIKAIIKDLLKVNNLVDFKRILSGIESI
ncbi:hypothetical protein HWV00_21030 (plasmid) [Moritella sp. 24]|uniref:hypothetical protein n=1 Tax=Moritella sp. 24 TaxID=2746230 RepID=UPI001BA9D730|nr:hypothetical protein [Moritella sp. 24]QUM78759.1 hypothetical protein HWV00_21030 [Moritella sp. 24]